MTHRRVSTGQSIEQLIENSSLGSRSAKQARNSVSVAAGRYIVRSVAARRTGNAEPPRK